MNFFNSMTNLKSAPDLPSMELASQCYCAMFKGCTGLTTAPELPATTLDIQCYYAMFSGCSKLSKVTMLATNYSAKWCLDYWLNNAGTSARSRTLKLASENVYNELKNDVIYRLPEQWQSGSATIEYDNQ